MVDSLFLMRFSWWLLLWVLCLSGAAGSQTKPPQPHASPKHATKLQPNIILITLDTTRADRMGFLGSTRGLTPNLDGIAKAGVVFTRAYSHVPLTTA